MYKNTVDFISGNYSYLIEEIQTSPKVVKLLVTAIHDNGKVYEKEPVYGVGDDVNHALYSAYTRLVTKTVITNATQLQFVMQVGEILHRINAIINEEPV